MSVELMMNNPAIPQVWYFDAPGRAEGARMALYAAGIEYLDVRMPGPDFRERQVNGEFLFGKVPVLKVGGQQVAESLALTNMGMKVAGFTPTDPELRLRSEGIAAAWSDLTSSVAPGCAKFANEEEKKAFRLKVVGTVWPSYIDLANEQLERNGNNGYFVGNHLTIADVVVSRVISAVKKGSYDHVPSDHFDGMPMLMRVYETVMAAPFTRNWEEFRLRSQDKATPIGQVTVTHVPGTKRLSEAEFVMDKDIPKGSMKLTYFDVEGRGQVVRAMLAMSGIKFQDYRISFPDYGGRKAAGEFKLGIPQLQIGGNTYLDSRALGLFAGDFAPDAPKGVLAQAQVEMAVQAVEGLTQTLFEDKHLGLSESEKAANRRVLAEGRWKSTAAAFDKLVGDSRTNWLFHQPQPTAADVTLAAFITGTSSPQVDNVSNEWADSYRNLKQHAENLYAHPVITSFAAKVRADKDKQYLTENRVPVTIDHLVSKLLKDKPKEVEEYLVSTLIDLSGDKLDLNARARIKAIL